MGDFGEVVTGRVVRADELGVRGEDDEDLLGHDCDLWCVCGGCGLSDTVGACGLEEDGG